MNVLFVTAWLPTDLISTTTAGISRRQHILIDALQSLQAKVHVLLYVPALKFDGSQARRREIEEGLNRFWHSDYQVSVCAMQDDPQTGSFASYYLSPCFNALRQAPYACFTGRQQSAALEACLGARPDMVVFHRLVSMIPALTTSTPLPPSCLDLDDVEHVAFARRIAEPPQWPAKHLLWLQVPALMALERRAIARTCMTFVCSALDQRKLQKLLRIDNVETLPNALPLPPASAPAAAPTLLMLGYYRYGPNRLGAEYFLDHIWPLIRAACPTATATLAGAHPELIRHSRPGVAGVTFPGFVADLDALYADTRVVVCPILSGGGTRIKIIEAAAYGRPIVSTVIGAEGIELIDGHEILLCEDADSFARACVRLLEDPDAAAALGARARRAAMQKYARGEVVARLAQSFEQCACERPDRMRAT